MKHKLYLAGSIKGLTYDQANEWRQYVTELLRHDIVTLNPLRGKEELRGQGVITSEMLEASTNPMCGSKGIVRRDLYDIRQCDAMLVNLLEAGVSIGTLVEIGYAAALRKPIVVVMPAGNVYRHPFVTETAAFVVETLQEACNILSRLFG